MSSSSSSSSSDESDARQKCRNPKAKGNLVQSCGKMWLRRKWTSYHHTEWLDWQNIQLRISDVKATIMDQFIGTMMHQTNSLRCRFADGSFTPHTLPLPSTTQCCVLWNDVGFRPTQFCCQH